MGEIAGAAAHIDNRPSLWCAQIEIRLHEVMRKRSAEQRTRFRRSAIISGSSLSDFISPAVVAFAFVIKRRLHPIMKSNRTFALDALAKSFSQNSFG